MNSFAIENGLKILASFMKFRTGRINLDDLESPSYTLSFNFQINDKEFHEYLQSEFKKQFPYP